MTYFNFFAYYQPAAFSSAILFSLLLGGQVFQVSGATALAAPATADSTHSTIKDSAIQHSHDHSHNADNDHDHATDEEHSTDSVIVIDRDIAARAGLQTAVVESGSIRQTATLFGVISALPQQFFRIEAPFDGVISQVWVQAGAAVSSGQPLLSVINSSTLQEFSVKAPASGTVLQVLVNRGERSANRVLLELADLSKVQLELSVFPAVLQHLTTGMPLQVQDLHGAQRADSHINHIAPVLTAGHIARARAELVNQPANAANPDNSAGIRWRPGMHVRAEVTLTNSTVPLRIANSALQQLDGQTVLFIEQTSASQATQATARQFRPVAVQILAQDGNYSSVNSLEPGLLRTGMSYVTAQSFLLKADLGKAAAEHQH